MRRIVANHLPPCELGRNSRPSVVTVAQALEQYVDSEPGRNPDSVKSNESEPGCPSRVSGCERTLSMAMYVRASAAAANASSASATAMSTEPFLSNDASRHGPFGNYGDIRPGPDRDSTECRPAPASATLLCA